MNLLKLHSPIVTFNLLFQILALDLLKARVSVMPVDTRKTFIGTVLVGLIEKTTDAKVRLYHAKNILYAELSKVYF